MILSTDQIQQIKTQALAQSRGHKTVMLLDNNFCTNACDIRHIEFAAAFGVKDEIMVEGSSFDALEAFVQQHSGEYVFTWLGYDLKNELEKLSSQHEDRIGFEPCYAFVPAQLLVITDKGECVAGKEWVGQLLNESPEPEHRSSSPVQLVQKVSREQYISDIEKIRQHIIEGDVYELNYCTEFYAENVQVEPEAVYQQLIRKSPVPFAAFVKHNTKYLISASPERFITRKGERVYSQPIKGTSPRGNTPEQDDAFKQQLLESEKERAENLMIVDLVRNDLAKTAVTGSVKVDELFGIYRFPQVHQMISTVSAAPQHTFSNAEVIKGAFPMGSMTGAPKIMAMKLIEQYEQTKRGLYSGTVGYFAPSGDFDFNVVIRSIQYNAQAQQLSFEVGSAITYDSVPGEEYNECLLKAKAMMEVLKGI